MNAVDQTVLDTLGVYIRRGGDTELWPLPERKEPEHNDWYECPLREADLLEQPEYLDRKVSIPFVLLRPTEERLNTVRKLFDHPSIALRVDALGATYILRPLEATEYSHRGGLVQLAPEVGILTIDFEQRADELAEALRESSTEPRPTRYSSGVTLAGRDLGAYGITLSEVYDSALAPLLSKRPDRESEGRLLILHCAIVADRPAQLRASLGALFRAIDVRGPVELTVAGTTHLVYYTKMGEPKISGRSTYTFILHFHAIYDTDSL